MGRNAYTAEVSTFLAEFDLYRSSRDSKRQSEPTYAVDSEGNPIRPGFEWWSRKYWYRWLWGLAGGSASTVLDLLKQTPGQLKLLEDAAQNYNLIQDHDWWLKDYYRELNGDDDSSTAGRVPMALNRQTTWQDLKKIGIDGDNDPLVALKWNEGIVHGVQKFDRRVTRTTMEQA